ncbi:MAG: TIGR00730 family Rossman fold protein [Polyangiaceae bacterium]
MRRVCVFSGSRPGVRPSYARAARELGERVARSAIGLVYGGASVGLMREAADAALALGGEVIGVIPRALVDREIAHPGLTELRVVDTMHARKATMHALSDGFIALPGGFGTIDELFEVLTWAQLGMHAKPVGLLDVDGYWDPLVRLIEHTVTEGFTPEDQLALLVCETDGARLLARMNAWKPPVLGAKWVR